MLLAEHQMAGMKEPASGVVPLRSCCQHCVYISLTPFCYRLQPIEHLASFRAMPNICMMRPGDGTETAGCYKAAVLNTKVHTDTLMRTWALASAAPSKVVLVRSVLVAQN